MDGWRFFRELEKKKSAFEEGNDMIGIAYLVEGLGALNNEMLRGWLGGELSPTRCCGHHSWKINYTMDRKVTTDFDSTHKNM